MAELQGLGLLATPQRPEPRPLEYEDLGKLTYLSCAIKVCPPRPPLGAMNKLDCCVTWERTALSAGELKTIASVCV